MWWNQTKEWCNCQKNATCSTNRWIVQCFCVIGQTEHTLLHVMTKTCLCKKNIEKSFCATHDVIVNKYKCNISWGYLYLIAHFTSRCHFTCNFGPALKWAISVIKFKEMNNVWNVCIINWKWAMKHMHILLVVKKWYIAKNKILDCHTFKKYIHQQSKTLGAENIIGAN